MINAYPEGILILYILHSAAAYMLCRSKYSSKKTGYLCIGIALVEVAVFFVVKNLLLRYEPQSIHVLYYITFAIFVVFCFSISAEPFFMTMFIILSYAQLFLVITFASIELSVLLFDGDSYIRMWIREILQAAALVIYWIFLRERVNTVRKELIKEGWIPICVLSFLYMVYLSYIVMTAQGEKSFRMDKLITFLLLLAVMSVGYVVIFHMICYMREVALNRQIERQNMIMMQKLRLMQKSDEEAKRLRHDFRHHMLNISEYAKKGENKALLRYLGEYENEIKSYPQLCAEPVIDGILQAYDKMAAENGIETEYKIEVKGHVAIREVDLVAILGNLLENAVNGCRDSGRVKKKILVKIVSKEKKLVIVIQNTCSDDAPFAEGTDDISMEGGIGISSIIRSAEKYNGVVDFKNMEGIFLSRIILQQ